jgi:hypothetical protein
LDLQNLLNQLLDTYGGIRLPAECRCVWPLGVDHLGLLTFIEATFADLTNLGYVLTIASALRSESLTYTPRRW